MYTVLRNVQEFTIDKVLNAHADTHDVVTIVPSHKDTVTDSIVYLIVLKIK